MKPAIVIALSLCLTAEAAEPLPRATAARQHTASPRQPLDLRIRDVRNYMMPSDYRAAMRAPDTDRYTIIVEGHRPSAEVQSLRAVPMGLGAVAWSFRHPARAWRIFLPDVHAPPPGPVLTRVSPPAFRPGP